MGHVLLTDGLKSYPEKVKAIRAKPTLRISHPSCRRLPLHHVNSSKTTQNSFGMNRFMAPPTHSKEGYFFYTSAEIRQPLHISCTAMRCIYAWFMNPASKTARLRKMCWSQNQDLQQRKMMKRDERAPLSPSDTNCAGSKTAPVNVPYSTLYQTQSNNSATRNATFHSEKSLICKMTPSLKGDRVIIPFQTRGELDKKRLQFSHRGMHTGPGTGSLLLALFNLYKEIEEYISKCQVCNIYQQEQQKEPMILRPYASPFRSW